MSVSWKYQALSCALVQMFSKVLFAAFPAFYVVLTRHNQLKIEEVTTAVFATVAASNFTGAVVLILLTIFPKVPKTVVEAVGSLVICGGMNCAFYVEHAIPASLLACSLYGIGLGIVEAADLTKGISGIPEIHDHEAIAGSARLVGLSLAGIAAPLMFLLLYHETGLQATLLLFSLLGLNTLIGVFTRYRASQRQQDSMAIVYHAEDGDREYVPLEQEQELEPMTKCETMVDTVLQLSKTDTIPTGNLTASSIEKLNTEDDILLPAETFSQSNPDMPLKSSVMFQSTEEDNSFQQTNENNNNRISSVPALPLAINGKTPFGRSRSSDADELPTYRPRTHSQIEGFMPPLIDPGKGPLHGTPVTSTPMKNKKPGDRNRFTPDATENGLVSDLSFDATRSVSLKLLESSKLDKPALQVTYHRRSVSSESVDVLTPLPSSAVIYTIFKKTQALYKTPAYHLLILSIILTFYVNFMVTLTLVDWSTTVLHREQVFVVMFYSTVQFVISGLALQFFQMFSAATSKPRLKLIFSCLIAGLLLLFAPYVHHYYSVYVFALICGAACMLQQLSLLCMVPLYLPPEHLMPFRLHVMMFTGFFAVGAPAVIADYETEDRVEYELMYQVFGVVCLIEGFLWLIAEPCFKRLLPRYHLPTISEDIRH